MAKRPKSINLFENTWDAINLLPENLRAPFLYAYFRFGFERIEPDFEHDFEDVFCNVSDAEKDLLLSWLKSSWLNVKNTVEKSANRSAANRGNGKSSAEKRKKNQRTVSTNETNEISTTETNDSHSEEIEKELLIPKEINNSVFVLEGQMRCPICDSDLEPTGMFKPQSKTARYWRCCSCGYELVREEPADVQA